MTDTKKVKSVPSLSREQIFTAASKSLQARSVEVEEWGGHVMYKPMTMTERREIRKRCQVVEVDLAGDRVSTIDAEKFEVHALIYCCVDEDGKLLFTIDDVVKLEKEMAAGPISVVSGAILRDSGLAPDAIKRGEEGTQN